MGNLDLYEKVRAVPQDAQKTIGGGRIKGMTDINPMWRIKTLTEQFGPCGIGWYYSVDRKWLEPSGSEMAAFVDISLYIRYEGEWSKPIHGTGGSMFASKDKSGIYVSDECYKMATTDAISVACKQLGIGADIYWSQDSTKYSRKEEEEKQKEAMNAIIGELNRTGCKGAFLKAYKIKNLQELPYTRYAEALEKLKKLPDKETALRQKTEQTAKEVDGMDSSGLPFK